MDGTKKSSSKKDKSFKIYKPQSVAVSKVDMYSYHIPAGFPSPAEDFIEKSLDLNEYLIRNKPATFLIKVEGNSMINAGINDGDLLIIDRSIEPGDGHVILGVLNGEFTIKRLKIKGSKIFLVPENENFGTIEITGDMDFKTWGVVTYSIHQVR
jgi:DNA polymerase V